MKYIDLSITNSLIPKTSTNEFFLTKLQLTLQMKYLSHVPYIFVFSIIFYKNSWWNF